MLAALTVSSIIFCVTTATNRPEGGAHRTTELTIKISIYEALGNREYHKTEKCTKIQINFTYLK